jgi:nitrate/TMAO reductase-like tetraheme cytochrome c subunit
MGRFVNIEYVDWGKMKEHIFGSEDVGNCVNCGEFLNMDEHHTITQSRGGKDEKKVKVCRKCHQWIGEHPKEAAKKGLYISGYKING